MNLNRRSFSMIWRAGVLACAWAAVAPSQSPAEATAAPVAQTAAVTAAAPDTSAPTTASAAPSADAAPAAPAPSADAAPGAPAAPAPTADAAPAPAAMPDSPPADFKTLDQEVQGVKKDVIDLNKDLFVLEEELLFPANTQVAVFVSMDVGTFFALDSVTIKIDNKEVANYLYTAREADALLKGGVHRIYIGNQKVGKHELVAFFTGKGPVDRDYRRGATLEFDKGIGAKYLELKITDHVPKHQPEFAVKDWE
jgi:hypothetical protein